MFVGRKGAFSLDWAWPFSWLGPFPDYTQSRPLARQVVPHSTYSVVVHPICGVSGRRCAEEAQADEAARQPRGAASRVRRRNRPTRKHAGFMVVVANSWLHEGKRRRVAGVECG